MVDHLPSVYQEFREQRPELAAALDSIGAASDAAGPLEGVTHRLVKLGIAVGAQSEGAVRSNARKALEEGADPEAIRHVTLLAITTRGFPAAIAALGWVDEVLAREA